MTRNTYQLALDFAQILTLVKQLPEAEKEKTITEAVEEVRAEMYAKGQQG